MCALKKGQDITLAIKKPLIQYREICAIWFFCNSSANLFTCDVDNFLLGKKKVSSLQRSLFSSRLLNYNVLLLKS